MVGSITAGDPLEPPNHSLKPLFDGVAHAVERGSISHALRLADRARRAAPLNATCAALHSRLLLLGDLPSEAFEGLDGRSDPESAVIRCEACCKQGEWQKAAEICHGLLQGFAADKVENLARLVSRICDRETGSGFPGWIGVDSQLRLVGQVRSGINIDFLPGRGVGPPAISMGDLPGFDSFICTPPATQGPVSAFGDGSDLIGSGLSWPPDFKVSGWVALDQGVLVGEVELGWAPGLPIHLAIGPVASSHYRLALVKPALPAGPASFSFRLNLRELDLPAVQVSIVLPDGKLLPLPGSPLKVKDNRKPTPIDVRPERAAVEPSAAQQPEPIVDIIVPMYAGYDESLRCLNGVLATTDRSQAEVVAVNDASPDSRLSEALERMAAEGRITLLVNEFNQGFPGAANRGLQLHPERDVVLLNSDTEVSGNWLDRLRAAAYKADDIGTVTPLSEAGSITDYRRRANGKVVAAAEVDRIASEVNAGKHIELPVGVGLCLFIRRACIRETGLLDEDNFAVGYGEETDYCLRARALGWRHVASAEVFIAHSGGCSYGRMKEPLKRRGARLLNSLHPGYDGFVREFLAADPLLDARRAIDLRRLQDEAQEPVLLVTLNLDGGVRRHVQERQREWNSVGHTVIVLQTVEEGMEAGSLTLLVESLGLDNLIFHFPEDAGLLGDLLKILKLSHLEIHHFLGLPASVLEIILSLPVSYDIYLHDYSWVCPRVTLIGGNGTYCGEPDLEECEVCVRTHGGVMGELLTVAALREQSGRILAGARKIVAPSFDARARILRYLPGIEVEVSPWEQPVSLESSAAAAVTVSPGRVRVAVIGAIGIHKGYRVLLECARDAAARDLDLEFSVIGSTCDDRRLLETGRVFITGPYKEQEAAKLLDRENCNAAFMPSVWPETWCYSLTYLLARGLPVLAFNLGAQAERLRDTPGAALLPLSAPPREINYRLLRIAGREPPTDTNRESIMSDTAKNGNANSEQREAEPLNSTVQVLTLPPGLYSFTAKRESPAEPSDGLSLPAIQLGLAPVRPVGNVEFITGASTLDRWLARDSDMIIVKIAGGEASLLLTSLRYPSSPALAVDARRLNADIQAPAGSLDGGQSEAEPPELQVEMLAHIRNVGDLHFTGGWAGWPGMRLWIEAFAVTVPGHTSGGLVEYRGVGANGMQTAWLSSPALCGTRGAGAPMLGFAVRLKPEFADRYECEFSGRFHSGATVGPLHDGELCVSQHADDPLEGLQIRITEPALAHASASSPAQPLHFENS